MKASSVIFKHSQLEYINRPPLLPPSLPPQLYTNETMKHLSEYRQQDEHAEQLYTHAVANQNTVPLAK